MGFYSCDNTVVKNNSKNGEINHIENKENLPEESNTNNLNNKPEPLIDTIKPENYHLVKIDEGGSCLNYILLDKNNQEVDLPKEIKEALECPSVLDLQNNNLIYWNNDVCLYNLKTKQRTILFTPFKDLDGISNPAWFNSNQLALSVINQERKNGYKTSCRIITLKLENGQVVEKRKFDRNVNFSCGSICSNDPELDFGFLDESTLWYRQHLMADFENEITNYNEGIYKLIALDDSKYNNSDNLNTYIKGNISKEKLQFLKIIDKEQGDFQKEIDLGNGKIRNDTLCQYLKNENYELYLYHTYSEYKRGSDAAYYFTLLKNGEIIRENIYTDLNTGSVIASFKENSILFTNTNSKGKKIKEKLYNIENNNLKDY